MPFDNAQDFSIAKLLSGVAGALASMRFIAGTWPEKLTMAVSGAALSYFGTTPAADWLAMRNAEGLVGFLIGLFGMAIVSKGYEVIQMMDAKKMAADIWEWVGRKWRA
jgi:hypothetical protein